ncbi:calcium/sodium antiporter [Oceanobacillus neutriphilus]|uniref:K+-dependent Na+/Ca+ exchanger n=1 Tax=Oceanobacillus neutriphilus TaxID=531815 RepID=A0ABQ2NY22_9BACI|nr:calcium/sodium antiporter [Oceanobacillus neutriphilus]GGP13180.1 K+-dependent Na+/Ca+ exchanger [Oceanobacillus neutriphilus]
MEYVLLIIGFALLVKGADWFVDGSSNIAQLLRVPPILIGLTIVALGTSAPEATVSIIAAVQGTADVAVGNVVGSNIFNITMVVGLAAAIYPLQVQNEMIVKQIPFALLAAVALFALGSDMLLQGSTENILSRSDGIIFFLFLAIFMYYIIEVGLKSRKETKAIKDSNVKWGKSTLITLLGLAAIILGGQFVVTNATEIALSWGMSEALVGLTIVAIGTSLPELVTSISAALKNESEIALGNVVGSGIFNILFVLGAASLISPLSINPVIFTDIWIMIALTILLLIFSRTSFRIGRREGIILALIYIVYTVYIIIRN